MNVITFKIFIASSRYRAGNFIVTEKSDLSFIRFRAIALPLPAVADLTGIKCRTAIAAVPVVPHPAQIETFPKRLGKQFTPLQDHLRPPPHQQSDWEYRSCHRKSAPLQSRLPRCP